jgi:hypothetical protein
VCHYVVDQNNLDAGNGYVDPATGRFVPRP